MTLSEFVRTALVSIAIADVAALETRIHMATFASDENYEARFLESLKAKEAYAKRWGYTFEVFNDNTIDCGAFRPLRWRGDLRYCKLEALKKIRKRVRKLQKSGSHARDYIFWHDVDTHIMRPEIPLTHFATIANYAPVIFTENALSLNNGVFFLQVDEDGPGKRFYSAWRRGCRSGEWPWADNGCMYEVMLHHFAGERYTGACTSFGQDDFNEARPEPPTGEELMKCFNSEMDALGMGCCDRDIKDFAFLTGEDSFNHHPCDELLRKPALQEYDRALIQAHCFEDGMFMVHSKDLKYAKESLKRVQQMIRNEL